MILESNAALQIQKPIEIVFEGIVNPELMTQYFISESSGRLETNEDVLWKFPEFEEWFPITNVNDHATDSISFVWDPDTLVKITLEEMPNHSTLVRVNEKGKKIIRLKEFRMNKHFEIKFNKILGKIRLIFVFSQSSDEL